MGRRCSNPVCVMLILAFVLFGCRPFRCKYTSLLLFWSNFICVCIIYRGTNEKCIPIGSPALSEAGAYQNSPTNSNSNAFVPKDTSVSKTQQISLKFCIKYICAGFSCYCCDNQTPSPPCYDTKSACQAECPACNPVCPPDHSHIFE
jgi:hypothetical protein